MIKSKINHLRQLKQQILDTQCNITTLKQNNTKSSFEYAKIKTKQLKQLKSEFQQAENELHSLLDNNKQQN